MLFVRPESEGAVGVLDFASGAMAAQAEGARLAQLNALNTQLHYQAAAQRRQEMLAQVLFDTEQTARKVRAIGKSDAFAAAMHAEPWLAGIRGIGPEFFSDVNSKRAWQSAFDILQGASTRARQDSALSELIQAHTRILNEQRRLAALSGGDLRAPGARLLQLQDDRRIACEQLDALPSQKAGLVGRAPAIGAVAAGLFVVNIVMTMVFGQVDATDTVLAGIVALAIVGGWGLLGVVSAPVAVILLVWVLRLQGRGGAKDRVSALDAQIKQLEPMATACLAFQTDPQWAPMLQRIVQEHPLLTEPPSAAAMEDGLPPSQVVERQTVVTRCQYCGSLTPVDLKGCQDCGAKLR